MKISWEELTGKTDKHVVHVQELCTHAHKDAVGALIELQNLSRKNGFEIVVASGFRSYEKQLQIWKEKISGKRPIRSDKGEAINITDLLPDEILFLLLRWSAYPGTSRHHWGTDFDIYDKSSLPSQNYNVELIPSEYEKSGPFFKFRNWLENEIKNNKSFNFSFPYQNDVGGVAPEPWHLSYTPLAQEFEKMQTKDNIGKIFEENCIDLYEVAGLHLDNIYKNHIVRG